VIATPTLTAAAERFNAAYASRLPELGQPQPAPASIDDQLQELLAARCTPEEISHYGRFRSQRRDGLQAARQGNYSDAQAKFALARRCLREIDTADVRLVGASSYLAAVAYLRYRQLKPAQARRLAEHALTIDVRLETEFALGLIYAHRIQLAHNLVRVEARFGTAQEAIKLAVVLLEQLEGRSNARPTSHPWEPADHKKVDSTQRRLLFNLVISDIALLQLEAGPHVAREASNIYQRHLAHCSQEQQKLFTDGHTWLTLRVNLNNNTIPESLNLASEYLERGPREVPILWYETAMSAALELCKSHVTEARALGERILEEGTRLPFAPKVIRAHGFPR
jgi:cellobiose-specific phosphotransferase system component IIA